MIEHDPGPGADDEQRRLAPADGGVTRLGTLRLSYGTRDLSAPEVTLLMMLETVLGPLWAWLMLGEVPGIATLTGGTLVALVVVVHSARTAATAA